MPPAADDVKHLRHAARLAVRGHGGAEPNPMVGCVILDRAGQVVGYGHHVRCGGPHAEVHALRRAGALARGGTAYVTLEPCNHHGRTGPCSEALVAAGIGRVVYAQADPHPAARGGADRLRSAGVIVEHLPDPIACSVSRPFVHRVRTGLPWVIVKSAITLDGRVAARSGDSTWISSVRSRRLVHAERGRVDVIVTGIGTVLADDPMLTSRIRRPRRAPARAVIDPGLRMPLGSKLASTARQSPVLLFCSSGQLAERADAASALIDAGVTVIPVTPIDAVQPMRVSLRDVLAALAERHSSATVLVEAGPTLVGALFREKLVNELWLFTCPVLLGDERAFPLALGIEPQRIADGAALELVDYRRRGPDLMSRWLAS